MAHEKNVTITVHESQMRRFRHEAAEKVGYIEETVDIVEAHVNDEGKVVLEFEGEVTEP